MIHVESRPSCAFLYKAATRANYVPQQGHKKLGKNLVSQLGIRTLEIAIRLTGQTLLFTE